MQVARSVPIHKRLATTSRSAVISLPMMSGEDCVALSPCNAMRTLPYTDAEIDRLGSLIAPFGPALALRAVATALSSNTFDKSPAAPWHISVVRARNSAGPRESWLWSECSYSFWDGCPTVPRQLATSCANLNQSLPVSL